MKTALLFCAILVFINSHSQITTPIIKAGFGVDADLKSNYFDNFVQSGNDDWFSNANPGTGQYVIDTTGATAIKNRYTTDAAFRMSSFYRGMSKPPYSVVNNRLWLDGLFIRDYHGNDSTVFTAGADKNGQSPLFWSGGVQGIPDKNDILDVYMHVRRAGPTVTDSLWLFGGLSLDNVTGNRYFDFEMYQTDIYYDRVSQKWYGYGPDAGHTSWQFDSYGNVVSPGDIIFSASYQSASLTNIEARIWVDRKMLLLTPTSFSWSGQFDGAGTGAQFGYASILPKNGGTFYTGLQCGNNEWAGAFSLVLQDNSVVTNYAAKQFMEFSVNLTKLGLDPVTVFGSDICGTPFNRLVVKTRASESFTSELKDFVAPIDLFLAPRVDVIADVPFLCNSRTVSNIHVQNPSSSSVYTWSTANGHIVGSNTGTSINVDAAGTYIVMQQLAAGCNPYAYDTVTIAYDSSCTVLANSITQFNGRLYHSKSYLTWTTLVNNETESFEVERSFDGKEFGVVGIVASISSGETSGNYQWSEDISSFKVSFIYYRLKIKLRNSIVLYSALVRLTMPIAINEAMVFPNPAKGSFQVVLSSVGKQEVKLMVYNATGLLIDSRSLSAIPGSNLFYIDAHSWKDGAYVLQLSANDRVITKKLIVQNGLVAE